MNFDHALAGIADFLGFEDSLDTVQSIRGLLDASAALLNEDLPDVGAFQASIPYREADGRQLTLDVIRPKGTGPFPVLVYIHGGAWVWGSPATHRKLTFRLAQQGFLVFSVDYRLAPEHPFPAAFHDCIHAVHFAAHNAGRWDGDPGRIVLAGDSAGANLAAATAIDLAGTPGTPTVAAVGLIYGVFDFSIQDDDTLTQLLADAYLGAGQSDLQTDARVSPLLKAGALPPAHIAIGTADPLIKDAEALRSVLARSGTVHDYCVYEGMPHAFMQMEFLPDARPAIQCMTDFLHETSRLAR